MGRRLVGRGTLAMVVGTVALLVAGGGYAIASSGGGHADARTNAGQQGAPAPKRAPKSVHAYAHVAYNAAAGTAKLNMEHNMGHAQVVLTGFGGFCFKHLPFTPYNATASIDWENNSSEEDTAQVRISPHGTATACGAGEHVRVETINANSVTEEHASFYISFN